MWGLLGNLLIFLLLKFSKGFFEVFTSSSGGRGVLGRLKSVLRDFLWTRLGDFSFSGRFLESIVPKHH